MVKYAEWIGDEGLVERALFKFAETYG